MAKRVDVMPFLAGSKFWGWKCSDEKNYGDLVLSMVRVIRMNKMLLRINELLCDYVEWW